MADEISISHIMRERQLALAHILQQRGHSLKAISYESGVPYSSLRSYFPGERNAVPAIMPVSVLYQLVGTIQDDLLSLLLPDGRQIVQAPEELDHDALCEVMQEYLAEKAKAHRPESEAGPAIGPGENARLLEKAAPLRVVGGL